MGVNLCLVEQQQKNLCVALNPHVLGRMMAASAPFCFGMWLLWLSSHSPLLVSSPASSDFIRLFFILPALPVSSLFCLFPLIFYFSPFLLCISVHLTLFLNFLHLKLKCLLPCLLSLFLSFVFSFLFQSFDTPHHPLLSPTLLMTHSNFGHLDWTAAQWSMPESDPLSLHDRVSMKVKSMTLVWVRGSQRWTGGNSKTFRNSLNT